MNCVFPMNCSLLREQLGHALQQRCVARLPVFHRIQINDSLIVHQLVDVPTEEFQQLPFKLLVMTLCWSQKCLAVCFWMQAQCPFRPCKFVEPKGLRLHLKVLNL